MTCSSLHTLIATDLDGTLLDHSNYSSDQAQPALSRCLSLGIPVIFNTSKTRIESAQIRSQLNINDPYIVENGSAIIIPKAWMARLSCDTSALLQTANEWVLPLGLSRSHIVSQLKRLKAERGFRFTGFSDMRLSELVSHTGLSAGDAELANQREYSEPLLWQDSKAALTIFKNCLEKLGLRLLKGGRFYHVLGQTDKGQALNWLKDLYQNQHGSPTTVIALGDSHNDIDMMQAADIAIWVRSPAHPVPDAGYHRLSFTTRAQGPAGWNEAITSLIGSY